MADLLASCALSVSLVGLAGAVCFPDRIAAAMGAGPAEERAEDLADDLARWS